MKPIVLIAEFTFKPDQVENALVILSKLAKHSREEDVCLFYELYKTDGQEYTYAMIERWTSHEGWQQHMETPHLKEAVAAIQVCLQKDIEVQSFSCIQ